MRKTLLVGAAIVMIAPFLYMVSVSFMGESELLRWPPPLFPTSPTTANYAAAIASLPFNRVLLNAAVLAGCVMIGQVLTSAAAGYAFVRLKFPGRDGTFRLMTLALILPTIFLVIPRYLMIEALGWIDTFPGLISTELAPETAKALWNQRMRWAQGWSQVSLRHLRPMMRRKDAPLASRIGAFYLLAWREVYPWFSLQMFPLIAFWLLRNNPPINWFVPIFVATTLFTLSAGPAQVLFAWKLAHPSIKSHKGWFVLFLLSSLVFYTEIKNVIVRTAHLKELMGERTWKVTPRVARPAAASVPPEAERRSPTSVGAALRPDGPGMDATSTVGAAAEDADRLTA